MTAWGSFGLALLLTGSTALVACGIREGVLGPPPGDTGSGSRAIHRAPGILVDTGVSNSGETTAIRLAISAEHPFRLSAGAGLTITPDDSAGLTWLSPMPIRRTLDQDYFEDPQEFILELRSARLSAVGLRVQYGYCPDRTRCILGTTTFVVPLTSATEAAR